MTARVLVVDDLIPNVKLLEAKLSAEYFDVLTAYDGKSALEIIEEQTPDIVLLDVMMPGMDGFEVCRLIKDNPKISHIPVVMVTALGESSARLRGLEVGAEDFLTKPVNDTALMARVRSLTRLKMTLDEWRVREETYGALSGDDQTIYDMDSQIKESNVLVLDDSPINKAKITKSLSDIVQHVKVVGTSAELYAEANKTAYDLIVVSILLCDEDGLRVIAQLRAFEETRQLPILVIVDEEDVKQLARGLDLGATDYITKPIDQLELQARTKSQIKRKKYQDFMRGNYERNLSLALTDPLTGLHNRRYVMAHMETMMARAVEHNKPVSILMLDIDHFKAVNDTYGHPVGDEVLIELAERVKRNVRGFDLSARLGGEEFIVVMPETDYDMALAVAERLRYKIANKAFSVSEEAVEPLKVTVSIGVAASNEENSEPTILVSFADKALYAAKNMGRNCVVRADLMQVLPKDK